ncbi:MAG TPA: hypothetical protein VL354_21655 [Spirochaetia bacterium]|nr:hypothetical protein [Spirochaetia bacterium]
MSVRSTVDKALEQGMGILRLAPNWVPRSFCVPGRRIKLHPADYYAFGGERGGIDERWFSSTTPADNGPKTSPNEGLSFIVFEDAGRTERVTLRDAIEELKGTIIGDRIWNAHKAWPMFAKFFDNKGALPHHVHHRQEHAQLVGQNGKPESYYFPVQNNNYGAEFPYTFFGLRPGTTKDQVAECLRNFSKGDNKITNLSPAFRLEPGTGWDVPAGILHAPGSLCTYEPQKASDIFAMFQSLTGDTVIAEELLWKNTPPDKVGNVDFMIEILDWEANVDPNFVPNHFMPPRPVKPVKQMEAEGYVENWITYKSTEYSAKELTVLPGKTITLRDGAAYGMVMLQGHGTMGVWDIETPTIIRFGQLTMDEFFVTESAARAGVRISNPSHSDPLVMLKHFGPENPDLKV